ncbi:hypothetical protein [Sorangium sp. So ce362]|uniref:hypothetical protein n=1 Tax=Sorangium sp. So ce362 TaxID=3133303 RepID=UPI003F5F57C9
MDSLTVGLLVLVAVIAIGSIVQSTRAILKHRARASDVVLRIGAKEIHVERGMTSDELAKTIFDALKTQQNDSASGSHGPA